MNIIEINYLNINNFNNTNLIRNYCLNVLEKLKINNWEISVLICDNSKIKELNSDYRGKNEPTDVLSFCQDLECVDDIIYAGDIVISIDMVKTHSALFEVSADEEFKRVLIHGILHLNGMDHKTNSKEEKMLVLQENLLNSISGDQIL